MQNRNHIFTVSRFFSLILAISLTFATLTCEKDFSAIQNPESQSTLETNAKPQCESCDILFIGSSYLSYAGNDVIEVFSNFATAANKDVYIDRRALGGWRLYKHAQSQETIDKINERKWDYIILQGNAAFLSKEKWHHYIIPYLKELRRIIKNNSPQTCVIYMMPWAYLDGLAWIEGETDTYQQMQENLYRETTKVVHDIDIVTAPAGWAWYTAITNGYAADLYLNDYNHQSKSGAYLTACVFYSTIFEEAAPLIPYPWGENDDAQYLHGVAHSTVVDNLSLWNIYY